MSGYITCYFDCSWLAKLILDTWAGLAIFWENWGPSLQINLCSRLCCDEWLSKSTSTSMEQCSWRIACGTDWSWMCTGKIALSPSSIVFSSGEGLEYMPLCSWAWKLPYCTAPGYSSKNYKEMFERIGSCGKSMLSSFRDRVILKETWLKSHGTLKTDNEL